MSEQAPDESPAKTAVLELTETLGSAIAAYLRDVSQSGETAAGVVLFNVVEELKFAGCLYREIAVGLQRAAALVAASVAMEADEGE